MEQNAVCKKVDNVFVAKSRQAAPPLPTDAIVP